MFEGNPQTAVLLIGYKRIDFLKNRLSELSRNKQIPIIVSIDGSDLLTEEIFSHFLEHFMSQNPTMKIKYSIQRVNLGLSRHVSQAITEVLNDFEQTIVVEDDIILSNSFVANMLDGFDILKQENNIGLIGGFSLFSHRNLYGLKPKWRKSLYFPSWGWGVTREVWRDFQLVLPDNYEEFLKDSRVWQSLSTYRKGMWLSRFKKVSNENPFTWDYQMQYLLFRRDLYTLLTTCRISDNVGFESEFSTNTKGIRPRWMGNIMVFDGVLESKISIFSRLYQQGDVFTISGDTRLTSLMRQFCGVFRFFIRSNH